MAEFATTESYAIDDRKPDLRIHVFEKEGNDKHDLTNFTNIRFYLRNMADSTFKINGTITGNSIDGAATDGILKHLWGATDLDTGGRYHAWFKYDAGTSEDETTTVVEIHVQNAWERAFV